MKPGKNFIRLSLLISLTLVVGQFLSACSVISSLGGKQVTVEIVYGSEKKDWLEPLVEQYNNLKQKTADGAVIVVTATAMGSIESVEGILDGALQPTVWSPASSIYLPVANAEWRKTHADDLAYGSPKDLVLSPVVIAMWKPMAEVLGWPDKALGWADIAQLAVSQDGWEGYGYPEWGNFKFGHTHPEYSNSGIVSVIAEAYAGVGKVRGLTEQDLQNEKLKTFMADVESSIIHYGTSTGFFAERMFERGPSYLSAAVLYENLVVAQESKRLAGSSTQLPVVAIYPKEGTFWSNHPYVILNAPWVTAEQRSAAEAFQAFLLDRPQQVKAIELGFRPADPSIPLSSPLDFEHGVDTAQPKTVLEIPSVDIISGIQSLWKETKKPVDLVVVIDISGSMEGEKISSARESLVQFINLLEPRDRLQVIAFNGKATTLTPLTEIGEKRDEVTRRISGIIEGGGTSLYDATIMAYDELLENGDPKHIRAIVLLSDGEDTASKATVEQVVAELGQGEEEGGNSIKLFTIAFGDDANQDILKQLAEITGGKQYKSDPATIRKIYGEIATFF